MSDDNNTGWSPARPALRATGTHTLVLPGPPPWTADGLCAQVDTELFFPEKGGGTRTAKSLCRSCTVMEQCLEYALEREDLFGVWGGTSGQERKKILAQRKRDAS